MGRTHFSSAFQTVLQAGLVRNLEPLQENCVCLLFAIFPSNQTLANGYDSITFVLRGWPLPAQSKRWRVHVVQKLTFTMAAVAAVSTILLAAAPAAAASPGAKPHKAVSSAVATVSAKDGAAVEIAHLQPFANIAEIPVGSDLSSIRFEGIKLVKVATRRTSITDTGYCEEGYREPGAFMHCPSAQDGSLVPAYQITYSYNGPPISGSEYGSTHFTFSVNVRPEDLNPTVRQTISEHKMSQTTATEDFKLTTYRGLVPRIVIDDANSVLCAGNYIDGFWTRADRNCEEKLSYKTVAAPAGYIVVRVDPAASIANLSSASGN